MTTYPLSRHPERIQILAAILSGPPRGGAGGGGGLLTLGPVVNHGARAARLVFFLLCVL